MTSTMRKLKDSHRVMRIGREFQFHQDCKIIDSRIQELEEQVRAENDLPASLALDELRNLRARITAATK